MQANKNKTMENAAHFIEQYRGIYSGTIYNGRIMPIKHLNSILHNTERYHKTFKTICIFKIKLKEKTNFKP